MKYSRQRELILKTLQENVVHPTADFIYNVLKKQVPNLSLATVYRNLHLLAENGVIKRIDGLDGSVRFDHNTHEHYHFICARCGKVYDIPYEVAPQLADAASSLTGLDIREYDISFKGYCPSCKTNL